MRRYLAWGLFPVFLLLPVMADVTGMVQDAAGMPVEGAVVRIQTDANTVTTGPDGLFTLSTDGSSLLVTVAAGKPYDRNDPVHYLTTAVTVQDGAANVIIQLDQIPVEENTDYFPIKAAAPGGCGDCHDRQLNEWTPSRHANAALNQWVNDLYDDFIADNPGQTGYCATCHSPAAASQDPGNVFLDQLGNLPLPDRLSAEEGVNCSSCHQIDDVNDNVQALHLLGNATMRFPQAGIGGVEPMNSSGALLAMWTIPL